jgi:hypothetical protein
LFLHSHLGIELCEEEFDYLPKSSEVPCHFSTLKIYKMPCYLHRVIWCFHSLLNPGHHSSNLGDISLYVADSRTLVEDAKMKNEGAFVSCRRFFCLKARTFKGLSLSRADLYNFG